MRPLFAVLLAVAILGSVQGYMVFQRAAAKRGDIVTLETRESVESGDYQVLATLNFDASPEAFQLHPAALIIYQIGAEDPIARFEEPIQNGTPVELAVQSRSLKKGMNELTLEAWLVSADRSILPASSTLESTTSNTKPADGPGAQNGPLEIQLQWSKDNEVLAEQSLEVRGDSVVVRGRFTLELP